MRVFRTYLLSLLLGLFTGIGSSSTLNAQTRLAVDVPNKVADQVGLKELNYLTAHSVELLILQNPVPQALLSRVDSLNIPYLINSGNRYFSLNRLISTAEPLQNQVVNIYNKYRNDALFNGLIFFNHSQTYDSDFISQSRKVISDIGLTDSLNIYYRQKQSLYRLKDQQEIAFYLVADKDKQPSISYFNEQLARQPALLITSYDWLLNTINRYERFEEALNSVSTLSEAIIPLPNESTNPPSLYWPIIIVLLLWISLALNSWLNPAYKHTIGRYFLAHRFYVNDIMSYRDRSTVSGFFLMIQHAVFGGLVVYLLAKINLSPTGLDAFYSYMPQFGLIGENYFSLFLITGLFIFVVEIVALLWIYLPNTSLNHFNQVLNLYTWLFHLDFVLVSLMTVLYYSGYSDGLIHSLAFLYGLFWFLSFNFTVLDSSKRLGMERTRYLVKTIALHSIATGLIISFLTIFDGWLDFLSFLSSI